MDTISAIHKGTTAELYVQYRLASWGILTTMCHQDTPYDLIADIGGRVIRIQVKSTSAVEKNKSSYRFGCGKGSKVKNKYTLEELDLFIFFAHDKERMVSKFGIPDSLSIRYKPEEFTKENEEETWKQAFKELGIYLKGETNVKKEIKSKFKGSDLRR